MAKVGTLRGIWPVMLTGGLALMFGSLLSVLVAWTISYQVPYPSKPSGEFLHQVWPVPVPKEWPSPDGVGKGVAFGAEQMTASLFRLPSRTSPKQDDLDDCEVHLYRCGLPFRCMSYHTLQYGEMDAGKFVANSVGLWPIRWSSGGCWLPVRPVWPGFALNTLFYAALAWGLWQVPLALRRRRRRGRGMCVDCGYDRKGIAGDAACPECGTLPRAPR